jgi:hypothetical protein
VIALFATLLGLLTVAEAARQAAHAPLAWAAGCVALVCATPIAAACVAASGGAPAGVVAALVLFGGLAEAARHV